MAQNKLKLYNTLTRKKEAFKPLEGKKVKLYACGPTVYWYAHIGNLRTYIFEDILKRVLEYNGYQVKHVMNITDVGHLTSDSDSGEDKMVKAIKREGKELNKESMLEIAERYTRAFQKDLKSLNIKDPDIWCKATEYIQEQIGLVKEIVENGFAYETEKAVYFDTSKLEGYGELAKLDMEGLKEAARAPKREDKKNPTDFALWLKLKGEHKNHIMNWDSPWGKGFPGWHVECSAMSIKNLGERFDIHCGGIDHIPVHHTNERAQNIAAKGHPVVNFWMHGEFLVLKEGRMGKSEGNIITVEDIKDKGISPLTYRYLNLTAHYRSKLVFGWKELESAQNALNNLELIQTTPVSSEEKASEKEKEVKEHLSEKDNEFSVAINNDLNMPQALAVLWKVIDYEHILDEKRLVNDNTLDLFKEQISRWNKVFGLPRVRVSMKVLLSEKLKISGKKKIPAKVWGLVEKREEYRKNKEWDKADKARKELEDSGWTIEDTPEGPMARKK
ncbi:MAG: cysteine--tRNA ligase [Candidatus Nealsonbacteria bacterium]|nr:cysteine--tRNA ligase [Candidatus Nealsonbacteria bacterium]